jgi:NAD(P)H-hydrate epimerase
MDALRRQLYVAAQVREMDRRTIEGAGIAGYTLMQRAAAAAFDALRDRWPQAQAIAVLCGSGNNGGDGYEIARLARAARLDVTVWQFGVPAEGGDAWTAREAWIHSGGTVADWPSGGTLLSRFDVIVDAIFGTGLSRPPPAPVVNAIGAIAAAHAAGTGVLAVDIPSGLTADSGAVLGSAAAADVTVTFIGNKLGLYVGEGPDRTGAIVFAPLDAPVERFADLVPHARLMDRSDLHDALPLRTRTAHKGNNGHVLIIGGDSGMAGAALLAGRAALRAGAGLVTVATRQEHAAVLTAAQPEIMFHGVDNTDDLMPLLMRATVVAIGPGLGRQPWGRALWAAVRERNGVVADADALNLLAEEPLRNESWILTPHPGEAARLLGLESREVQADRITAVCALRERYGGTVVLKGAGSLVAADVPWLCCHGNPGMGVGGMGDVLTGVIAGLRAQGLSSEAAARHGVLAHALAGDRAAAGGERGLLPSDLLAELRQIVNPRPRAA